MSYFAFRTGLDVSEWFQSTCGRVCRAMTSCIAWELKLHDLGPVLYSHPWLLDDMFTNYKEGLLHNLRLMDPESW
jgi:hypothetical protein